jgi:mutator protein MutT
VWHGHEHTRVELEPLLQAVARRGPGRNLLGLDPLPLSSAVLIALFDGPEGAEVVLTRRAMHLSSHRGEISFPGGRLDEGETPVQAALREAHEEVGLEPALVTVVGELDHLFTISSASGIVPVVGRLAGRPELVAATPEVDRILVVPLLELIRPGVHREERWGDPPDDREIHFFELPGETVWGATARMLVQLLSIALDAEP